MSEEKKHNVNDNLSVENVNEQAEAANQFPWKALIGFAIYLLLAPVVLFISAGTWQWEWAWVYSGMTIILTVVSRVLMFRMNPGLAQERASYRDAQGVKPWDRVLGVVAFLYGNLAILIVAGLDKRFGWPPEISLTVPLVALVIALLGFFLGTWALLVNRFFSAVVRIQTDRGHTVCTTGPYRFVRHPGYAGGILFCLATPFILETVWALVPAVLMAALMIVRTALEDKTLQAELDGYRKYARKVRYRLLPGVW
ncbi:MAG: isoprenylcysteine carboxylmethyltransferase family protein [Chloroflexi bacterium]|nr:isoprenylcysteine carboxylmethyltransferase family protein [Chloroflexota bacterium]